MIPASGAASARPLLEPSLASVLRRRIARQEIEARLAAELILHDARDQAERTIAEARLATAGMAASVADEVRRDAEAELAARWLALREAEHRQIDREADRVLRLAVVLAERLLGAELNLDSSRIALLARTALDEARGTRRAVIDAHPLDADALRTHLGQTRVSAEEHGIDLKSVEVRCDASLARGDLRLHTDMGVIDARLAPRFERLASALRDALRA
ncbi:MAG: FliH/SctL family protein [Polyangiaceae bacterium]